MPTAFAVEDGLITSLHWTDLPGVHRVVQARFRERAAANTANTANAANTAANTANTAANTVCAANTAAHTNPMLQVSIYARGGLSC